MNAGAILKLYFDRKRVSTPAYSLRALARDLKVSPAYVSQVFNGKKPLPESRLAEIIRILDLDDIAVLQLKEALYTEKKRTESMDEEEKEFLNRLKPLDKTK